MRTCNSCKNNIAEKNIFLSTATGKAIFYHKKCWLKDRPKPKKPIEFIIIDDPLAPNRDEIKKDWFNIHFSDLKKRMESNVKPIHFGYDPAKPGTERTGFSFHIPKIRKPGLPVGDVMEEAAKTFKARQAVYGDNYKLAAEALKAFFPNGLELKTAADQERYHIFMLIVVKLSRYANGWTKPHQDSIHDAGIYSFMLEAIDQNQQSNKN